MTLNNEECVKYLHELKGYHLLEKTAFKFRHIFDIPDRGIALYQNV